MKYSQLLDKLRRVGLEQVGRMYTTVAGKQAAGDDVALIARPNEAVFPFQFDQYPIYLDKGMDTEIDEEIIEALLRRFEVSAEQFEPLQ